MDYEEGELISVGLEEGELKQPEILENSFSCDKCPAQLESKEILSGHRFTYHGVGTKIKNKQENKFPCNLCKSRLKNKRILKGHMDQYHKEYICPNCNKKFVTQSKYYVHNETIHNLPKSDWVKTKMKCDICEKVCRTLLGLKSHIKTHSNYSCNTLIPFKCNLWSKSCISDEGGVCF